MAAEIPDARRILLDAVDALPADQTAFSPDDVVAASGQVRRLRTAGVLHSRGEPAEVLAEWTRLLRWEGAAEPVAAALDSLENHLAWQWPEALHLYREMRSRGRSRIAAMVSIAGALTRQEAPPTLGVFPGQIHAYADVAAATVREISRLQDAPRADGAVAGARLVALREQDQARWQAVVTRYGRHSSGAALRAWWALAPWSEAGDTRAEAARREMNRIELRVAVRQPDAMKQFHVLRDVAGHPPRGAMLMTADLFRRLDGEREARVSEGVRWMRARRGTLPVETVRMTPEHREMFATPVRRGDRQDAPGRPDAARRDGS